MVQPFPPTGTKYQVIAGAHPVWSKKGTELFALRPGQLALVPIRTQPQFTFGNPVPLPQPFVGRGPYVDRNYDILPDGQHFIAVTPAETGATQAPRLVVVERWFDELNARVPARSVSR
jgi:hypothetical protein